MLYYLSDWALLTSISGSTISMMGHKSIHLFRSIHYNSKQNLAYTNETWSNLNSWKSCLRTKNQTKKQSHRVSLHSSDWPGPQTVELTEIPLPLAPECWDQRQVPLCQLKLCLDLCKHPSFCTALASIDMFLPGQAEVSVFIWESQDLADSCFQGMLAENWAHRNHLTMDCLPLQYFLE